jgi:hypothetical protein
MITEITFKEKQNFADYCEMFYGEGQLYGESGHANREQIMEAINIYLMRGDEEFFIDGEHRWGGGDTVDREIIAGILMEEFDINLYNWKAEA